MFPELKLPTEKLLDFNRIVIVACGTAYHAGMVGKSFYEHLLRRPVEVQVASEFRYNDPIVDQHTLAIIISQSGETADTLAALREAKVKGATTLAIVNVVGSSIAREADEVIYTYAGLEISVASTKAYVSQLIALYLIGLYIAQQENKLDRERGRGLCGAAPGAAGPGRRDSGRGRRHRRTGRKVAHSSSFFFLGRGFDYAVAMEAALKLKEVSYIHAEAYAAGEMKHGPLALVEPGVSVVCFATQSALYDKMLSNVKEVKARDGIGHRHRQGGRRGPGRALAWTGSSASPPPTTRSCPSSPSSPRSSWPTTSPPTWAARSTSRATWRSPSRWSSKADQTYRPLSEPVK